MSTIPAQTGTRDVVDAFFARFGEGDMPALLDLFADGVTFHVGGAPNVPWAGSRTSKDDIAAFFASFGQHLTPAKDYVIATTIVDGDHAVVIGHNRFGVLATGKTFTNHFALHITAADGKITGYRMYEDSHAISEAFAA
ncbi:nuclear transport factor 2 family protein [Streptomyces sp. ID05-18]|uniref:nuclear transport factor 2 family protein n=1 Tax=Streptomyces sp. ID05-18 TaxID=3028662 RepID=UPI0029ADA0A2|nr:nuclear transport factor 2 family protein [Streptomyces sp. ID05-18]MDX3488363.1 nuclear transport factor 2 family protein [Streptomyces sp. ID05-18]